MTQTFDSKIIFIKNLFADCANAEAKYNKIMELGKQGAAFDEEEKTDENLVPGCQSTMYLQSWIQEGCIHFNAWSDALISAGLAQLLILAYSGQRPEVVLKKPPAFLDELNIPGSLTPNRANGLFQIHLRMKQDALRFITDSAR